MPSEADSNGGNAPSRSLSLFDVICLIVGIIIGVGVYQMAPDVAKGVGSWRGVLIIWAVGGLLSLCGALSYAELASAYPKEGGDYVYLSKAYGPWAGFLFGWIQVAIVRPGDIAIMAFAFATYGAKIYNPWGGERVIIAETVYAASATLALTALNVLSVHKSKWTQNILTAVKAVGLLAIVAVGLLAGRPEAPASPPAYALPASLALIFVLFCYGGWNEIAYVAAEVKNSRRNILRSLVIGMVVVTGLYLLINGVFLYTLGFNGVAGSKAVAADTVEAVLPELGGRLISILICISALGAVNGLIFAGSRISYAVGKDHALFRPLGRWSSRTGTPVRAVLLQGAIAIGLIVALRSFIGTVITTAPAVYTFYFATSLAVIILRRRDPGTERPYRVLAYPVPPLLFCVICGFLIHSAVTYAIGNMPKAAVIALVVPLLGLPMYGLSRLLGRIGAKAE